MRLFAALLLVLACVAGRAQSAQYTQVPLNTIDVNAGIPVAPTEMVRHNGALFAIIIKPNSSETGWLWRSDDDGDTWTRVNAVPDQDQTDTKILELLSTGNSLFLFTYYSKLGFGQSYIQEIKGYRSTDGGATFTEVFAYTDDHFFGDNFITLGGLDEANGRLYCYFSEEISDNSRLFISENNGTTWDEVYHELGEIRSMTGQNGVYYIRSEQAVYWAGDQWLSDAASSGWANGSGSEWIEYAASGNNLYFCNEKGLVITSGLFLNNITSYQLPFPLSAAKVYNGYWLFNSNGRFFRAPLQSPLDLTDAGYIPMKTYDNVSISHFRGRFVADGARLFWFNQTPLESSDGGLSWELSPAGFPQRGGRIKNLNNELWLFRDVIFRSNDGQNWALYRDPAGLGEDDYYWDNILAVQGSLFIHQYDYYDNAQRKVMRSSDGGDNWQVVWQGAERPALHPNTNNTRLHLSLNPLFVGTPGTSLLYSDDLGDTWNPVPGASNFTSLAAKGDSIFYFDNQKINYTYDLGQNWQTTPINTSFQYGSTLMAFPNGQVLLINNSTHIGYVSLDGGQQFAEMFDLQNFGTQIYASRFDRIDSLLIGWGARGTFISNNCGLNWIWFSEGPWYDCQTHAIHDGYLYAGSRGEQSLQSYDEPGLRTPLQPLLDQLNLVSQAGGVASGTVFYDIPGDCTPGFSDPVRPNEVFVFQPGNFAANSDLTGRISRILPEGNYSMQYGTPLYHDAGCFNPPNVSITAGNQSPFVLGFKPNQQVKDLAVVLTGTGVRPGYPTHLTLTVKNIGTQLVPSGTTLSFNYPDYPFELTGAEPAPSSQTAGLLSYNLPALPPYTQLTFKIHLLLAADPNLTGQTFYLSAGLSNLSGDPTPVNNSATFPAFITNSFDPNDKTAYTSFPTGELSYYEKELRYLIRFQNTGTDTAFRVVVVDTLSTLLDWSTLQTLSASHPYRLVMSDPGVASWRFDDIMLPDSNRNEAASHGFVYFSIKAKEEVRLGDTLLNRAAIYFDFNDPVITNQTFTKVVRRAKYRDDQTNSAAALSASVYPNPVETQLNWQMTLREASRLDARITDANGRLIRRLQHDELLAAGEHRFSENIAELPSGVYWLTIEVGGSERMIAFSKQ
ncbi:MAG: T9SS type A sorting domain-containing protein [Saprospiraceae bacterium]|nr:T9SS type A sorting domain-containing protein [Saprospiraceae bacterium]